MTSGHPKDPCGQYGMDGCVLAHPQARKELNRPGWFDVFKLAITVAAFVGSAFVFADRMQTTTALAKETADAVREIRRDVDGNSHNIKTVGDALNKTTEALTALNRQVGEQAVFDAATRAEVNAAIAALAHVVDRIDHLTDERRHE